MGSVRELAFVPCGSKHRARDQMFASHLGTTCMCNNTISPLLPHPMTADDDLRISMGAAVVPHNQISVHWTLPLLPDEVRVWSVPAREVVVITASSFCHFSPIYHCAYNTAILRCSFSRNSFSHPTHSSRTHSVMLPPARRLTVLEINIGKRPQERSAQYGAERLRKVPAELAERLHAAEAEPPPPCCNAPHSRDRDSQCSYSFISPSLPLLPYFCSEKECHRKRSGREERRHDGC